MSDHSYRWVSIRLGGKTDYNAIRRMAAQPKDGPRWEPCPLDEIPDDIEPPHPDPDKAKDFMLYRMSAADAARRNADLAFLNDALREPKVLMAIATGNIQGHIAERRAAGEEIGEHWDPAEPEGNLEFWRRVEVARKFLHERGLA